MKRRGDGMRHGGRYSDSLMEGGKKEREEGRGGDKRRGGWGDTREGRRVRLG